MYFYAETIFNVAPSANAYRCRWAFFIATCAVAVVDVQAQIPSHISHTQQVGEPVPGRLLNRPAPPEGRVDRSPSLSSACTVPNKASSTRAFLVPRTSALASLPFSGFSVRGTTRRIDQHNTAFLWSSPGFKASTSRLLLTLSAPR